MSLNVKNATQNFESNIRLNISEGKISGNSINSKELKMGQEELENLEKYKEKKKGRRGR